MPPPPNPTATRQPEGSNAPNREVDGNAKNADADAGHPSHPESAQKRGNMPDQMVGTSREGRLRQQGMVKHLKRPVADAIADTPAPHKWQWKSPSVDEGSDGGDEGSDDGNELSKRYDGEEGAVRHGGKVGAPNVRTASEEEEMDKEQPPTHPP